MNTLVSRDGKRAVTTFPAGVEPMIKPCVKRRHIVGATLTSGVTRTWQVSSKAGVEIIREAYRKHGIPTVYTVSL